MMRTTHGRGWRSTSGRGVTALICAPALALTAVAAAPFAALAAAPLNATSSMSATRSADPAVDAREKAPDPTLGDPSSEHGPDVPGGAAALTNQEAEAAAYTRLAAASTDPADVQAIRRALARDGSARVNVTTDVSTALEARLSDVGVAAQRDRIDASLDALRGTLAGTGARQVSRLSVAPTATYVVDGDGLDALLADDSVTGVALDGTAQLTLDVSTGVIDSDLLNAAGVHGDNFEGSPGPYEVAILDSGVDNQHNAFTGRISDQACFSVGSDCPNGATTQIGGNAGDNCTYTPVSRHCEHGTHVAGIAAGALHPGGHEGVADRARIIAIQIGSDAGGVWSAAFSDINLALQRVLNLRNSGRRVVSVNMSIGIQGFAQNSACDANNASFTATQNLAAQLQAAGVSVIAAAGNDNLVGASYPACLSSVFSVSASDDSDNVAGFTNSGATTDWWAPGSGIVAPIPPGPDTTGSKSGTSMAAPHVAGAWALMRECVDGNGVPVTNATVASRFNATGVNITDNGATRRRINVLDAATGLVNNNDFASAETLPANPGAGFDDFDFTVCSDTEPGEPGPFSLDNGVWWNWTPSATGTATISTEDGGGNVTTFDTTLAVYTGASLGTLTNVAADDDSGTGLRSSVTFPVNGGTTYRIKVDGFGASNGLLNLHIVNGPPPTCLGAAATLVGTGLADTLTGTAGDDVIVSGAGNDSIAGGGGNDRICAGDGDDAFNGEAGQDTFDGGTGRDRLTYINATAAVDVDMVAGTATGGGVVETFTGLEDVVGSAFSDRLVGDAGPNLLVAGMGADRVDGGGGNDTVAGNKGNDLLRGRAGNDVVNGNEDVDTVAYDLSPLAVVVDLTAGTATGEGADTLTQVENVTGSGLADRLTGDGVRNALSGLAGNDRLSGLAGNDALAGGTGTDTCAGGSGTDTATSCEVRTGIP